MLTICKVVEEENRIQIWKRKKKIDGKIVVGELEKKLLKLKIVIFFWVLFPFLNFSLMLDAKFAFPNLIDSHNTHPPSRFGSRFGKIKHTKKNTINYKLTNPTKNK